MEITSFERVDAGCLDEMATHASSSYDAGNYTRETVIRTAAADANLSAWVERTSPRDVDLSTFRVHVDSHHDGPTNRTCETGVLYRITLVPSGGSGEGLIPDAHGTRVQWMENGEYAGCSGSLTSPLDGRCPGSGERPPRTWANASAA